MPRHRPDERLATDCRCRGQIVGRYSSRQHPAIFPAVTAHAAGQWSRTGIGILRAKFVLNTVGRALG